MPSMLFQMGRSSSRLYRMQHYTSSRVLNSTSFKSVARSTTPYSSFSTVREVPTAKFLELSIESEGNSSTTRLCHPLFLRERDQNPLMSQQPTGQRYFEPTDYVGVGLKDANLCSNNELSVTFDDGHVTTFKDPSALAAEVLDPTFPHKMPAVQDWSAKQMPKDKLYFDYTSEDYKLRDVLSQIASHGAAVISNTPANGEFLEGFCADVGFVRNTNWGYFFSVKSEGDDFISSDNDVLKEGTVTSAAENMAQQVDGEKQTDIAYSNMKLMLHVDNPYRDPYPQYQLLHCVQAAPPGKGGESIIADGFHAAEILRRDFPAMFNILATTKMRVQYKDATTEQIRFVPCIETDPTTGDPCDPSTQTVKKIASSSRLDYCPNLPPAEAQLFYEAKQKWLQTIHSPEVALSWRLNDGDMLIVDNGRVMHGREAFENDATTTRHLEGCYMDRDSLFSSYLVLGRDEQKSTAEVTAVRVVDAPVAAPVEKTKLDNSAKVEFNSLAECTKEDMDLMTPLYAAATSPTRLTQRALGLLKAQKGGHSELGAKIDLYQHGVQTATRAYRDGASDEMVACALLHDIGELLSPSNHGDVAAGILRPYISQAMWWTLANHEVFQGHYYYEHAGLDPNARDRWLEGKDGGHMGAAPEGAWELCAEFCEKYDAPSFDPEYQNMELEEFVPILERVFSKEGFWDDAQNAKKGAVTGAGAGSKEESA
ncbi:hypothetical protein TeGR_g2411 [Tetraparma gracilis]|uniref:TauD/TfdA-like domain-containing protein n=1 Tax=Tetraparma gracilis TaxID=2962635 RepID=A0ABQ6N2S5_9STRA|nr:hypothetical protein TeGR_g2411 [Tetraparma gracilis]